MTRLRQRMLEDLRGRNYSPDTIRGYIRRSSCLLSISARSPEQLGAEPVRRSQIYSLHERKLAPSSVENCMSVQRFLL